MKKVQKYNIKLIILDFDGTLVDSVPGILKTVNIIAKKYKIKCISKKKVIDAVGAGLDKFLEKIFKNKIKNFDLPKLKKEYVKIYKKNYFYKLRTYKGVKQTLCFLYKKKITNIIISNKLKKFVKKSCKYLNIDKYIKEIFGRGDLEKDKPHPFPIFYVMKKYNISKDQILVVGDSIYDCTAAKKAKVPFVFLTYGYGDKDEILKKNPEYCLDEFSDIKKIIYTAR